MNKKWMPIVAGILEIVDGFGILTSAFFFLILGYIEHRGPWQPWDFLWFFLWLSIPFFLGIVSVVGGVCALRRRKWRLAFAGAAAAISLPLIALFGLAGWIEYDYNLPQLYTFGLGFLLSISPIVLLSLSKREFK